MEMARSIIHAKDLPTKLWAEAVNTAVHILNRTINCQLGIETPYERWFREKPSVNHYRIFGSLAWIFVNKQQRTKLDPKSVKAFFVCYSSTSRAYRFWDPVTNKIIESSDCIIDECSGKYPQHFSPDPSHQDYVYLPIDSLPVITDPGIHLQRPIEIINEISHQSHLGDLNSSGSWSNPSNPNDVSVNINVDILPIQLPVSPLEDSPILLQAVGALSSQVDSSIAEPDDANDEP